MTLNGNSLAITSRHSGVIRGPLRTKSPVVRSCKAGRRRSCRMLSPMARTFAPNAARDWTPWCAGTCTERLVHKTSAWTFQPSIWKNADHPWLQTFMGQVGHFSEFQQDYRGVWFKLSREGHYFEMNEPNRARTARKLGGNVVVPLLLKGDRIRLKDGTQHTSTPAMPSKHAPPGSLRHELVGQNVADVILVDLLWKGWNTQR